MSNSGPGGARGIHREFSCSDDGLDLNTADDAPTGAGGPVVR